MSGADAAGDATPVSTGGAPAALRALLVTDARLSIVPFPTWCLSVARAVLGADAAVVAADDCLVYASPYGPSGEANEAATRLARWAGWDAGPGTDDHHFRGPVIFTGRDPDGLPCSVPLWFLDAAVVARCRPDRAGRVPRVPATAAPAPARAST